MASARFSPAWSSLATQRWPLAERSTPRKARFTGSAFSSMLMSTPERALETPCPLFEEMAEGGHGKEIACAAGQSAGLRTFDANDLRLAYQISFISDGGHGLAHRILHRRMGDENDRL